MPAVRDIIASQNQNRAARGLKPKKPKRIVPQRFPTAAMRKYRSRILALLDLARAQVDGLLIPLLPALHSQAVVRLDAWPDDLEAAMAVVRSSFTTRAESQPELSVNEVANSVSAVNRDAIELQLSQALGADVFVNDPAQAETIQAFTRENVRRIRSLPMSFHDDVEDIITRGFRQGRSVDWLREQISERFGVAQRRAALIADDQVNKLNGQLTRNRQVTAGVDSYRWRTRRDRRVRPAHAEREGSIFSWDDPPDGGHPGEAVRCRCDAEPVLDDLA